MRQGKTFTHYGKTIEQVKKDQAAFLDRSDYICAYHEKELIGVVKLIYRGDVASILTFLPKASHHDKRPANAIMAKAVELCVERGIGHLVFGKFNYGTKKHTPLREFKIRNGFDHAVSRLMAVMNINTVTFAAVDLRVMTTRGSVAGESHAARHHTATWNEGLAIATRSPHCASVLLDNLSPAVEAERKLRQLERLAKLGTLSANMAHEIRNTLLALRTFADLFLEKTPGAEIALLARREVERIDSIPAGCSSSPVRSAPPRAPSACTKRWTIRCAWCGNRWRQNQSPSIARSRRRGLWYEARKFSCSRSS